MSKIDTSAAAVERLRDRLRQLCARPVPGWLPEDPVFANKADVEEAANKIERLLAERDEAIDQRNAADFVLALSIEQSNRHSAERDAARAEVERLNEAIISERHGWQAEVERLRREVLRVGGVQ